MIDYVCPRTFLSYCKRQSNIIILCFCLFGCLSTSPSQNPLPSGGSSCDFQGVKFFLYKLDPQKEKLQLWLDNKLGRAYKNIGALKSDLDKKGEELLFAMNAGMYKKDNSPQGLYRKNNNTVTELDTSTNGYGNFYLSPNGVFAFNENKAVITSTEKFHSLPPGFHNATQSGPMLVIDGEIHPKFKKTSTSKYIRNGVGLTQHGDVIFAYSAIPVNLFHFAELFRTHLKCEQALYLDGAISKLYLPSLGKEDLDGNLGPLIGTTRRK